MLGMCGIRLESRFRLQSAVEHHIRIGRSQTAVDMHLYVKKTGHLAHKTFKTGLYTGLDNALLFLGETRDWDLESRE